MKLITGDCLSKMRELPDNSVDAVVTDPPYGLSFMGKKWDYDVPSQEIWQECLRVLKPGGYLLSFAGTRTQHRMAVRIEDAGFEIRDMIAWVYGSGFPKSLNIGKAVDNRGGQSVGWFGEWLRNWRKENNIVQKEVSKLFPSKTGGLTGCVANWELGLNMPTNEQFNLICKTFNLPFNSLEEAEREVVGKTITNKTVYQNIGGNNISGEIEITKGTSEWEGWGTALKPALEPITVARKPLSEKTVAENCLKWGTGGINIDGCRVGTGKDKGVWPVTQRRHNDVAWTVQPVETDTTLGRWPANLIHDGSDEVVGLFSNSKGNASPRTNSGKGNTCYGEYETVTTQNNAWGDSGSASRFFYCAKASKKERNKGCEELELKVGGGMAGTADQTLLTGSGNVRNNMLRNNHPTVKPIALMEYLVKLVSREGQTVLDPFMGSGTTGIACKKLKREFIGIELEPEYVEISKKRIGAIPLTLL